MLTYGTSHAMGYLAGFTWGRRAGVVAAALDAGRTDGTVLVVGPPALARALAQRGRAVAHAAATGRLANRTLRARADALPIADGALGALVAATEDEPHEGWLRAVRGGGVVVLIVAVDATELSRRALCAGLTDLEERRAGRLLVMSGLVWRPSSLQGK
jgi:hypothetical protein